MADRTEFNIESFERYFVARKLDFGKWLRRYTRTRNPDPFSMTFYPKDYDLHDLFSDLLQRYWSNPEKIKIIVRGVQTSGRRKYADDLAHAFSDAVGKIDRRRITK